MLTLEEHIAYWLESAENDLRASENMFNAGNYDWCLFVGHLVLEKAQKALYVLKTENKTPPKIHNLLRLAQLSNLDLNHEQAKLFSIINKFQMEARYPEYKNESFKMATN